MTTRSDFFTVAQYGKETTKGTAAAATRVRVGVAPRIVTDTKPERIMEQFNIRMVSRRVAIYQRLYQSVLSTPNAGFQQMILPLITGLKGNISGSEVTPSQGDYLWTFTPGLTPAAGSNAQDAFTLQVGDGEQAWRIPYCMTDRISLKGTISQDGGSAPVSLEQGLFGRFIEENAFTAGQALEGSTPMNAKLARLYVDTTWAGVGTTEVTDGMVDFGVELLTGLHPVFRGSAANYFNSHREGPIDFTAAFTVDHALRDELLSSQQAGDLQVVRLAITGPVIGSGTPHKLTIDMGGHWEDVTPVDAADRGDNLSTLALFGTYDDTGAKGLQLTLTTTQSTI